MLSTQPFVTEGDTGHPLPTTPSVQRMTLLLEGWLYLACAALAAVSSRVK